MSNLGKLAWLYASVATLANAKQGSSWRQVDYARGDAKGAENTAPQGVHASNLRSSDEDNPTIDGEEKLNHKELGAALALVRQLIKVWPKSLWEKPLTSTESFDDWVDSFDHVP